MTFRSSPVFSNTCSINSNACVVRSASARTAQNCSAPGSSTATLRCGDENSSASIVILNSSRSFADSFNDYGPEDAGGDQPRRLVTKPAFGPFNDHNCGGVIDKLFETGPDHLAGGVESIQIDMHER